VLSLSDFRFQIADLRLEGIRSQNCNLKSEIAIRMWFPSILAALTLAACSMFWRRSRYRPVRVMGAGWRRLTAHPFLAGSCLALAALASCAWMSLQSGSLPAVHDEFSYLLAADTFAHGRLTNPPHPMWQHFETFHVLQQPTYASKYPPAQGLVLALGQLMTGRPIVGVWISMALLCAAMYWMLLAWVGRRWALVGTLIVILHLVFFGRPLLKVDPDSPHWFSEGTPGYWSRTYWGGAMAAFGGALVFGAIRRLVPALRPAPRRADSLSLRVGGNLTTNTILLGLGLAILANSRPFEGLVVILPAAAVLVTCLIRCRKSLFLMPGWKPASTSLVLVLTVTALWMTYYNLRVTGSPFKMPFQVYQDTYDTAPKFLWQSLRQPPEYRNQQMRELHGQWELGIYEHARESWPAYRFELARRAKLLWDFYLGPFFSIPALLLVPVLTDRWVQFILLTMGLLLLAMFLIPVLRNRWVQFALLTIGLLLLALSQEIWMFPHYPAPAAPLVFALVFMPLRYMRKGWAVALVAFLLAGHLYVFERPARPHEGDWQFQRDRILNELESSEGKHLVIVHYDHKRHPTSQEWVYNEAGIDQAKVIWARDLGENENRKLTNYFRDRKVWLLEADSLMPELEPIPP
jgi:hypothetical protein